MEASVRAFVEAARVLILAAAHRYASTATPSAAFDADALVRFRDAAIAEARACDRSATAAVTAGNADDGDVGVVGLSVTVAGALQIASADSGSSSGPAFSALLLGGWLRLDRPCEVALVAAVTAFEAWVGCEIAWRHDLRPRTRVALSLPPAALASIDRQVAVDSGFLPALAALAFGGAMVEGALPSPLRLPQGSVSAAGLHAVLAATKKLGAPHELVPPLKIAFSLPPLPDALLSAAPPSAALGPDFAPLSVAEHSVRLNYSAGAARMFAFVQPPNPQDWLRNQFESQSHRVRARPLLGVAARPAGATHGGSLTQAPAMMTSPPAVLPPAPVQLLHPLAPIAADLLLPPLRAASPSLPPPSIAAEVRAGVDSSGHRMTSNPPPYPMQHAEMAVAVELTGNALAGASMPADAQAESPDVAGAEL